MPTQDHTKSSIATGLGYTSANQSLPLSHLLPEYNWQPHDQSAGYMHHYVMSPSIPFFSWWSIQTVVVERD